MDTKISIIHPMDLYGKRVGGIATFLKGFIKYAPEDFKIKFIGITSDTESRPVKRWTLLKVGRKEIEFFPIFFEKDENKRTIIPLSLRFTSTLFFSGSDVKNSLLFFNRIEPVIAFLRFKQPMIVVVHNDIKKQMEKNISEFLWSKAPSLYFKFEKFVFKHVDHVYTVNNDTLKNWTNEHSSQIQKFSFLPTYVDAEIFHPLNADKDSIRKKIMVEYPSISTNNKWLLFVGRLQKQKSPLKLIDTLKACRKNDICLLIIGEGNLRSELEEHIKKKGLKGRVFILGSMTQDKLADFYNASDTLLLTSNYEGMPICVLEALGCGLPVVTTNVGEVNRVVKNGFSGEVVDSFDPEMISKAAEKILSNPQIYTKDNCVNSVREYTPQKVLTPLYEMMRKLYIEKSA